RRRASFPAPMTVNGDTPVGRASPAGERPSPSVLLPKANAPEPRPRPLPGGRCPPHGRIPIRDVFSRAETLPSLLLPPGSPRPSDHGSGAPEGRRNPIVGGASPGVDTPG